MREPTLNSAVTVCARGGGVADRGLPHGRAMALAKLAFMFLIVVWYRGDWVDVQLRRHARRFRQALVRLGLGSDAMHRSVQLEWTEEDGTQTPAQRKLLKERRDILNSARVSMGKENTTTGAAKRMAEKLDASWRNRSIRRNNSDVDSTSNVSSKTLEELVLERRHRAADARTRHQEVRTRIKGKRREGKAG